MNTVSPLGMLALIVACAPVFLIGVALANAVYQSWTHRDDDHD